MNKTRFEKEAYERTALLITEFDQEDIITTSSDIPDDDNALEVVTHGGRRMMPGR